MSTEFKVENLKRLVVYNRTIYAIFMAVTLLVSGAKLTKSNAILIYYILASIIMIAGDELVFSRSYKGITTREEKFPALSLKLRTIIYTLLLSLGGIFSVLPPILFVSVVFILIYIYAEDVFFCDIFSSFTNVSRIFVSGLVFSFITIFIQFRKEITGVWIITSVGVTAIIMLVLFLVYDLYYRVVMHMDDRYTKLYFENADIIAENNKLVQFREKVEKVNNEINYQKINLTKANDDLAKNNIEARSLIEVMKYFSSSFDVEKNAHVMISNVIDIKNASAVAFYIDKNIYMNEESFTEVISDDDVTRVLMNQDIENIFHNVKRNRNLEPLILCENYDFKYPYLTGGNVCNAVAFPAYENDSVYGVMVVASSQYDFFENGFSFYESSIMDFTSALISDRLYLKTEDMAKKDGLTKLYNRIYYNQFYPEFVKEILDANESLTVCMLDIDHFKNVNDTYGHLAGDEVIKAVARVDEKYAKLFRGYAVRFGGEEFLLILRDISVDAAHKILIAMHDEIRETVVEFENLKIHINTSMGLASFPETCDDIYEVVDRADKAMYYSKEHGRGMITVDGKEGSRDNEDIIERVSGHDSHHEDVTKESVEDNPEEISEETADDHAEISEEISDNHTEIEEKAEDNLTEISENVEDNLTEISEKAEDNLTEISEKAEDNLTEMSETTEENLAETEENADKNLPEVSEIIDETDESLKENDSNLDLADLSDN